MSKSESECVLVILFVSQSVFRACFVVACVVGVWSCSPAFLVPELFGLYVFCECFVSPNESK